MTDEPQPLTDDALDAEADRLRLADAEARGVDTSRLVAFAHLSYPETSRWRTAAREKLCPAEPA